MQLLTFFFIPVKRLYREFVKIELEGDPRIRVFFRFEFLILDPREFLCFFDILGFTNDFFSNFLKYLKGVYKI